MRKGGIMAKGESCFECVYSHWDRNQAVWSLSVGVPVRPTCGNQPDFPGRMRECLLGQVCANFRARPPTPEGDTVKTIPLGNGFYAYVDAADYEWLSQWTWYLGCGYAYRLEKNKMIYMHRQIMQPPKGMVVHHKSRNKLDNTRENMENVTPAENTRHRAKKRNTSSRFWGVSYTKQRAKYQACVHYKGKGVACGYFTDEIEAARARDYRAVELFGDDAQVNFPEEWPPERRAEIHAKFQASLKREGKKGARGVTGSKVRKEEGRKVRGKESKTGGRPRARITSHGARVASVKPRATCDQGRDRAMVRAQKGKGRNGGPAARRTTRDAGRGRAKARAQREEVRELVADGKDQRPEGKKG
jgi:hypothetical protein